MPIRDARCHDRAIKIDGQTFENCEFVNALLVYEGGPLPSFINCRLTNVQLRFNGAAASTAQLIGVWMGTPLAPFVEAALKAVLAPQAAAPAPARPVEDASALQGGLQPASPTSAGPLGAAA